MSFITEDEIKKYNIKENGEISFAEEYSMDLLSEFFNEVKNIKGVEGELINKKYYKERNIKEEFVNENYYYTEVKEFEDLGRYFTGNLFRHKKYGPIYGTDGDDSEFTRAFLFLFYKKRAKKFEIDVSLKIDKGCGRTTLLFDGFPMGGDTINTFNTLFSGGKQEYKLTGYSLDKEIISGDEDFISPVFYKNGNFEKEIERVKKFHKNYQGIGNFMYLPTGSNGEYTINRYRGWSTSSWGDYIYLFLLHLKNCYEKEFKKLDEKEKYLFSLMKLYGNKEYFKKLKFDDYIELNGLEDCFSRKDWCYKLDSIALKHSCCSENTSEERKKEYRDFAEIYINTAEDIIRERAKLIISEVKNFIIENSKDNKERLEKLNMLK